MAMPGPLNEGSLPLVYSELRKLAQGYIKNESKGHTLQATALFMRHISGSLIGKT